MNSFCLVYKKENNILAFNLNNDTISSIDISRGNSGTYEIRPSEYAVPSSKSPLSANDFDIAGLKLGDALSSDDQENWVKRFPMRSRKCGIIQAIPSRLPNKTN